MLHGKENPNIFQFALYFQRNFGKNPGRCKNYRFRFGYGFLKLILNAFVFFYFLKKIEGKQNILHRAGIFCRRAGAGKARRSVEEVRHAERY